MTRIVENIQYNEVVASPSKAINVASATVNNQTNEKQEMSITFSKSVGSSYTWGVDTGLSLTVGASVTLKGGVPLMVEGETTASASTTASIVVTMGVEHNTSETFSYTAIVSVPAKSMITANAVASSKTISGKYIGAKYTECWAHAGLFSRSISGTIDGLTAHDVIVSYSTLP